MLAYEGGGGMETAMRKLIFLACLLTLTIGSASAAEAGNARNARPLTLSQEFVVYSGDALLTRPLLAGLTVVGAGVYTATLPFTLLAPDFSVFDVLVRQPARAAFTRCLGCELEGSGR